MIPILDILSRQIFINRRNNICPHFSNTVLLLSKTPSWLLLLDLCSTLRKQTTRENETDDFIHTNQTTLSIFAREIESRASKQKRLKEFVKRNL
ncbi:hypothetical protein AQUCO_13300003v1 [Aquilegia coerulea]|uniref:Uncharacterized protein n=1 Tax=Aquilegia coerulea TaxID=218851 RepID=A0A2G5C148_AQUCA|nr:hypothetical protein AQUCO_13300003v1 [Aquilegia coerulea]